MSRLGRPTWPRRTLRDVALIGLIHRLKRNAAIREIVGA